MSTALRRSFIALPFFIVVSAMFALYTAHRELQHVEWTHTAIRFFHWSGFEYEAQVWSEWNWYFDWHYLKLVSVAMAQGFLCWLPFAAFLTLRKNSGSAA